MATLFLKSTKPFAQPTNLNPKPPHPPPLLVLSSLFLISRAQLITSQNFWLRRISRPYSNPIKPSNNYLELLKINLTQCLAQEFTKFLAPVENIT
jgi:hypothetical protein